MMLTYHRHGTELNTVSIDVGVIRYSATIGSSGEEGGQTQYTLSPPMSTMFAPGDAWEVQIAYQGDGADNGHFIDYISLQGDCVVSGGDGSTGQ